MDNKEAINWLTRIRDRLMTTNSKQFEAITIAIAALEQQEKDRWIPVTERLPEVHNHGQDLNWSLPVLVAERDKHGINRVTIGSYTIEGRHTWWDDENGLGFEGQILAWRPLPEEFHGE